MISAEQLAEWKNMHANAAGESWRYDEDSGLVAYEFGDGKRVSVCEVRLHSNGFFIAVSHQALPLLIAEVERLQELALRSGDHE